MNYYKNIYDADDIIKDGEKVFVPNYLMDSAPGGKSEAVRLRDEAHALYVDRLTHPKSYDPITGRAARS